MGRLEKQRKRKSRSPWSRNCLGKQACERGGPEGSVKDDPPLRAVRHLVCVENAKRCWKMGACACLGRWLQIAKADRWHFLLLKSEMLVS